MHQYLPSATKHTLKACSRDSYNWKTIPKLITTSEKARLRPHSHLPQYQPGKQRQQSATASVTRAPSSKPLDTPLLTSIPSSTRTAGQCGHGGQTGLANRQPPKLKQPLKQQATNSHSHQGTTPWSGSQCKPGSILNTEASVCALCVGAFTSFPLSQQCLDSHLPPHTVFGIQKTQSLFDSLACPCPFITSEK